MPLGHPDFGRALRCECKRDEDARRAVEIAAKLSDLTERQRTSCTFDGYTAGENTAALDAARAWASDPPGGESSGLPWLVLWGNPGSGKSHLLVAAWNALAARAGAGETSCSPVYATVPLLLDAMRGGIETGEYGERFEALCRCPVLLLDDLGAEKRSAWTDEALFKLVQRRYAAELPLAVATNLHPDDLEPRISSRLQDVGLARVVAMRGGDYRRSEARVGAGGRRRSAGVK